MGDRNGVIQGYTVVIEEAETGNRLLHNTGGSITAYQASMLHPYYTYSCKVAAYNSAGTGPFTEEDSLRTSQDG